MATRQVLAELAREWEQATQKAGGPDLAIESAGGVDAARRVETGEAFDLVFLSSEALRRLEAGGHLQPASIVALMDSQVAVAVPRGAPRPAIDSEAAVRRAVLDATSIGYSTGPSGKALQALFARWGVAERLRPRLVQASPGVPVGSLLASGRVALGFQQLSELQGLPGIDILGLLPAPIGVTTVFAGAVGKASRAPRQAARVLRFMADPAHHATLARHGMTPAHVITGDSHDH